MAHCVADDEGNDESVKLGYDDSKRPLPLLLCGVAGARARAAARAPPWALR